jgi:GT2 family glycosyltransferase
MSAPNVAAIVLSYNGKDVTLKALPSLLAMTYPSFDVVVADNGSTDGTREAVAAAFPEVIQVRSEENLGPAGGLNLGIDYAMERDYDYLLILNNDVEAHPEMLTELVKVAESDPTIGSVGPKAYYYWDRERIWSAGGRIRFREAITRERGEGELDRGQYDRDEEIGYTCGCAMLVKRAAVAAVGPMDPAYFLCFEDADFCTRMKRHGLRCYYAHRAVLWHMVSTSTGGYKPGKTFHSARSTAIFVRRHANVWQWLAALSAIAAALPLAYLRELRHGNQAAVVAKLRGFWAGFRERLDPPPATPAAWARVGDAR